MTRFDEYLQIKKFRDIDHTSALFANHVYKYRGVHILDTRDEQVLVVDMKEHHILGFVNTLFEAVNLIDQYL